MAPRNEEALRKAKEAKQKKLLIVLAPVFLGLAVWQGPKMYDALFSSPPPPPSAAVATTTPTDPSMGVAPTTQAAGAASPTAPGGLPDTDPPPAAASDRLVSFSRFTGRDPFGAPSSSSSESSQSSESSEESSEGGEPSSSENPESAVIHVNGNPETVAVDGEFPAGNPVFRLVSLTGAKAVIGLVSGSFEGGEDTVELGLGEDLTLVADPDGTRYTLKLVDVE